MNLDPAGIKVHPPHTSLHVWAPAYPLQDNDDISDATEAPLLPFLAQISVTSPELEQGAGNHQLQQQGGSQAHSVSLALTDFDFRHSEGQVRFAV